MGIVLCYHTILDDAMADENSISQVLDHWPATNPDDLAQRQDACPAWRNGLNLRFPLLHREASKRAEI